MKLTKPFTINLFFIFIFSSISMAQIGNFERYFGVTNINGVIGNGGLTAAFSEKGEMTVLKWPSPSYYEHLNYKTSSEESARSLPYMGAFENMGAFAGIYYSTTEYKGFTWFRDKTWEHLQYYDSEDSNILVTVFINYSLGISVENYSFVLPDKDVLVSRYVFKKSSNSKIKDIKFFYYENLAPCLQKNKFFPLNHTFSSEIR